MPFIKNTSALDEKTNAFRNELLQMPGVKNVTVTGFLPVIGTRGSDAFVTSPAFDGKNFTLMQHWPVDENYIPTLQLQLQSGRNFSKQFSLDSASVVINEAAAKSLGTNPINKKLYRVSNQYSAELRTGMISVTFSILAILIACLGLFGLGGP